MTFVSAMRCRRQRTNAESRESTHSPCRFLGFSWAFGIATAFSNGRNEESSSEAVHAYYAMYLFGRAVQNGSRASTYTSREAANAGAAIAEWGRLFLAMEIAGADTCVAYSRTVV